MKKKYASPKLIRRGTVAEVTQTLKDLGLFDNTYFKNPNNPLVNVS